MSSAPNYGIATGAFVEVRDDWRAAIQKARLDGWRTVELTAISEERLFALVDILGSQPTMLDGFDRVSIHAPVTIASGEAVVEAFASLPPSEVVFHPETLSEGDTRVLSLRHRLVIENMDNQKSTGRTVEELRPVFEIHPAAGFCLDVAHVWANDPTLKLGHDLLDNFGHLLRQLHISGIEPDGAHRPTTPGDLVLYQPLLARCRHVPWILEAELAN